MRPDRRERDAHRAFCQFREGGHPDAITRVFDLVAPRLLALAGHLARARADADDLVQSTFLDAIERAERFDPSRPLIPWMTGILLHHARHEHRRARRTLDRDRLEQRPHDPPAAREAEAREFAELVAASLDRLPELYREVVRMRLVRGLEPAEIAAELGRPRETVKTQLARGIRRLRHDLPRGAAPGLAVLLAAGHRGGPRAAVRAFAAARSPLAHLAAPRAGQRRRGVLWRRPRRYPAAAMGAASALLLALVLTAPWWTAAGTHDYRPAAVDRSRTARASEGSSPPRSAGAAAASAARRARTEHGELEVRVHWQRDGKPAAGITVSLRPTGDPSWLREVRAVTGDDGIARFAPASLPGPGPWRLRSDRGEPPRTVEGTGAAIEIELPAAVEVRGRVVDDAGAAVRGARIWCFPHGDAADTGAVVAVTGADGGFHVRDLPPDAGLGVLAAEQQPAVAVALRQRDPGPLTLVCHSGAAPILGIVLDDHGRPIAGAAVLVGSQYEPGLLQIGVPSRLRTDARGAFTCRDQGTEATTVWARAPGYAVARAVIPRAPSRHQRRVTLRLVPGATLSGRVARRAGDAAVPGARVEIRQDAVEPPSGFDFDGPGWARVITRTDPGGRYRARAIAPGAVTVRVRAPDGARTELARTLASGESAVANVALGRGASLKGILIDASGAPLAGWRVTAREPNDELAAAPALTGDTGHFELAQCELGRHYRLFIRQRDALTDGCFLYETTARGGDPERIEVPPELVATGFVSCRLVGPRGPVKSATFVAVQTSGEGTFRASRELAASDGSYRIGPMLPGVHALAARVEGLGWESVGTFTVGAGTVDAGTVQLAPPARLRVVLTDWRGAPAAIDHLWLLGGGLPSALPLPLRAGTGETLLQPGPWHVTYGGAGGAPLYEPVQARPGARIERRLQLHAGVVRHLRLADIPADYFAVRLTWFRADTEVLAETRVLNREQSHPWRMRLLPGRYRVVARDPLGRTATTEFAVDDAPSDEVVAIHVSANRGRRPPR